MISHSKLFPSGDSPNAISINQWLSIRRRDEMDAMSPYVAVQFPSITSLKYG
jgi:hypothetical protein